MRLIGFLQLQVTWNVQCRGWNGLVWNEARKAGGVLAKFKSWPLNQTCWIKTWTWVLGICICNKHPWFFSCSLELNPCSRGWRTSADISSSFLSWSLFLPLITNTQWTKGAKTQGSMPHRCEKAAGAKGRTWKLPSEKRWRPGPCCYTCFFGECMALTFLLI